MISIDCSSISTVSIEDEWNYGNKQEMLMHTIHAYPAKFPAFIAQKAFDYAASEGVNVRNVADVFCGCGTVALESKLHSIDFWGCDINPVATFIAKAKSRSYDTNRLKELYNVISQRYEENTYGDSVYNSANERLQYWFTKTSFIDLYRLWKAIKEAELNEKYEDAFICLFSSILKASSKWLTKSIKPQVDPQKREINIWDAFTTQYKKFLRAVQQINSYKLQATTITIENGNFLEMEKVPTVDMIISSPPYVTSYEYADLHQLSTLWLGYTTDYRTLRKGSIGSAYNSEGYHVDIDGLNDTGKSIVSELLLQNDMKKNAKVKAVARYYSDMQKAIKRCGEMMRDGGMAFFVVGDTEYKGVRIRNSEHLIDSMQSEGFTDIKATKRQISNKLCIPFRDAEGRFSSDKTKRTIYHEEYVISGRMWH